MTFSRLCGYLTLHWIVMYPNFLPSEKVRERNDGEKEEIDEEEPVANEEDEGLHDAKATSGN